MGLFDKALHEIEAGHPKSGAGLFAKARKTLEVQTPDSPKAAAALEAVSVHHEAFIPTPEELAAIDLAASLAPFSAEDLKSLSRELDSLPKGYDSLFAVFSRISEALPLSRLCLFSCESRLVRPLAALGWSLPKEALELTDASFLRTLTTGKALDSKKEPAHAELVAYLGEGQHRAFVRHGADGKPFALWIYSDPALDDSPELARAFAGLLAASPLPAVRLEFVRPIKPEVAGQRVKLGQGKAALFMLPMKGYIEQTAVQIPGLEPCALLNLCRTAIASFLGSEGTVFLLGGEKILAVLYSKAIPDAELALVQLRKSLSRVLPFLGMVDFPKGRSTTVDLVTAAAIETMERFASE